MLRAIENRLCETARAGPAGRRVGRTDIDHGRMCVCVCVHFGAKRWGGQPPQLKIFFNIS